MRNKLIQQLAALRRRFRVNLGTADAQSFSLI
jgi:hypothetical protein